MHIDSKAEKTVHAALEKTIEKCNKQKELPYGEFYILLVLAMAVRHERHPIQTRLVQRLESTMIVRLSQRSIFQNNLKGILQHCKNRCEARFG